MRKFSTSILFISLLLASPRSYSNGGPAAVGTAIIDERDLKELETEREPASRDKDIRKKALENPRNRAFPESFERVGEEREEVPVPD